MIRHQFKGKGHLVFTKAEDTQGVTKVEHLSESRIRRIQNLLAAGKGMKKRYTCTCVLFIFFWVVDIPKIRLDESLDMQDTLGKG